MMYAPEQKVRVYGQAMGGLIRLEPDPEKCYKYIDFINDYCRLDDDEQPEFEREYPEESAVMSSFSERLRQEGREEGVEEGLEKGRQEGEVMVVRRLLEHRFGPLDEVTRQRLEQASVADLERWADRILDAQSLAEVFESS